MNRRTLDLMRRVVEPPKYTFWYRNRDSGVLNSVVWPVGHPVPIFPPLKRRAVVAPTLPLATSCCLSWCKVPTAKHDAAKTERCLYYAIRKEAIDKRYAAFANRTRGDNGETAWALEKTNEELEALERQWRSLDPDRVRAGESP